MSTWLEERLSAIAALCFRSNRHEKKKETHHVLSLTSLRPLLVHDTVATLATLDGILRLDQIVGPAV